MQNLIVSCDAYKYLTKFMTHVFTNRMNFKDIFFHKYVCLSLLCILFLTAEATLLAQEQDESDIAGSTVFGVANNSPFKFITLTFENDLFVGDDDGFTNGVGFSYGKGPFLSFSNQLPSLLHQATKDLYIQTAPNKVRGVSYTLFQRIQTPQDIETSEFQPDDIPYAGLFALQTQLLSWDKNVADQLSISIGFVGPIALGEEIQTAVHSVIGAVRPEGWEFQLNNEPVFRLEVSRVQKLYRNYSQKLGFDVLGLATAGAGNLRSDVVLGAALRWGSNLEFTHSTFSLLSDRQVNSLSLSDANDFFFYIGAQGSVVFNDILFDGNTFTDSHSVEFNNLQNKISGGVVFKYGRLSYVFQVTSASKNVDFANERENFGALSVTYPFK